MNAELIQDTRQRRIHIPHHLQTHHSYTAWICMHVWLPKSVWKCRNIAQVKDAWMNLTVRLTCERILYSGSSTNSTKLRWELLLGAFFVNFLLIGTEHNQLQKKFCHYLNCLNKISLRLSRFRVEVNVSPQSFSKLHVIDITWKAKVCFMTKFYVSLKKALKG